MEKETYNKSLSARIRRRNKQGFSGNGTGLGFLIKNPGDYLDHIQNNKIKDYVIENARKNKLWFRRISKIYSVNNRALTKRFADNRQKMS